MTAMRTHQWRGIIEEYRDRLPVTDAHAGGHAARGRHAARARAGALRAHRLRGPPQGRGRQPHRVLQGPRHDHGHHQGRGGGRARRSSAPPPATPRASAAAYAVRAGMVCAVLVPAGQDRARQDGPGARARRASILQVDGNFDDCLTLARELSDNYPVALVNSVNPVRIEGQKTAAFEIVDALGDAPDIHVLPVGNAGNITAYWKGYKEYAADGIAARTPAHVGLPGLRRRARSCAARSVKDPHDHRHRDPDRQPGVLAAGARRPGRVRRPHRRGDRPADPRRLPAVGRAGGRLRRARLRRVAWPVCCKAAEQGMVDPGQRSCARSPATA